MKKKKRVAARKAKKARLRKKCQPAVTTLCTFWPCSGKSSLLSFPLPVRILKKKWHYVLFESYSLRVRRASRLQAYIYNSSNFASEGHVAKIRVLRLPYTIQLCFIQSGRVILREINKPEGCFCLLSKGPKATKARVLLGCYASGMKECFERS